MRLVQASTVPGLKGRLLRLEMDGVLPKCTEGSEHPVLFEPKSELLEPLGLNVQESLVRVDENGCMLVPVENF